MESGPPRWTRRSAASSLAEDGDAPHALFRIDRAARERRRPLATEFPGDTVVYVHSPEDVILQKLARYRLGNEVSDKQWADILGILQAQRGNLDRAYVGHWARELSVADLWEQAQAEEGLSNSVSEGPV